MPTTPVNYLTTPAIIVNQAIDILGRPEKVIGDITDGTPVAQAARRLYGQALRQLLRTAHWDFARKRATLTLLGNSTGTPNPLPAGVIAYVETPWSYAYAWPIDGVMGRWLPWMPTSGQPSINGIPVTTGGSAPLGYNFVPGRFLVSSSDQYPVEVGTLPWTSLPDLQRTFGVGPISRKVILSDCCNAEFVYTRLVTVIEEWDALFRQAFVTTLALGLAPTVLGDNPKERLAQETRLIPVLKNAIAEARVANGNESGMPQTTDFQASWIRARNAWGGWGGQFAVGPTVDNIGVGYFGIGWEQMSWSGSVF